MTTDITPQLGGTREQHLAACKQRAMEEYDFSHSVQNAVTSMISDLGKHPETEGHAGIMLLTMLLVSGSLRTRDDLEREIDGFR